MLYFVLKPVCKGSIMKRIPLELKENIKYGLITWLVLYIGVSIILSGIYGTCRFAHITVANMILLNLLAFYFSAEDKRHSFRNIILGNSLLCCSTMLVWLSCNQLTHYLYYDRLCVTIAFLGGISAFFPFLAMIVPSWLKKFVIVSFSIGMFIFTGLIWGYYFSTDTWINAEAVMAILQTNFQEAVGYLSAYESLGGLLIIVLIGIVLIYLSFITYQLKKREYNLRIIPFILIFWYMTALHTWASLSFFCDVYRDVIEYMDGYQAFSEQRETRKNTVSDFYRNISFENEERGIYVLIIGESQNMLHMSAYGYEKDTTPWLNEMKKDAHMLMFDQAYACHVHTIQTLTYALTAKNQYNTYRLEEVPSILEIAEKAGFETAWLSNQTKYGIWDTPVSVIADSADQQIWLNHRSGQSYDMKLLPAIDALEKTDKMLIVIHLLGNHVLYADRYPEQYTKFGKGSVSDEYDNSMYYNDDVVRNIYDKVRALPNFKCLIYMSDHADEVHTWKGHDAAIYMPEMTYIPFYMIFSDQYMDSHRTIYDELRKKTSSPFTNDLLFNTMCSIMGIRLDPGEERNDLTSPAYDENRDRFRTLYGEKEIGWR